MICVKLLSIFSIICLLFAKLEGQQQAYGGGGYSASGVASNAGSGYESAASGPKPAPPPPQPAAPAPAYPPQPAPAQAYPPQPAPSSPPSRPASAPTETGYGGAQPEAPKSKTHGTGNLGFPLPSCYVNADGFMCCNKELENLMSNTYRNISQSRGGKWKKCNIHQVAVATQRNAEKHFGVDFELVVGAGDYASKNYFNQDLICKIKRDNSIILAFATPT